MGQRLWYNALRGFMFEDKRCDVSLGLEKLAVGRIDLLPLRGTANSPPTFMVYWPRAPMPDGKRCKMSLGLEPSLRAGSLYAYSIIGWEKCVSISRERCL